jgi:hypothetical protein
VFSRRAREIGDVDGLGHDSITHEMPTTPAGSITSLS